ncbi:MAG: gliding motility-associated C-terminal domain-containing protein [Fluviicola sp.]
MIKPICYITILLLLLVELALAQPNLVANGSFEILSECPVGADIEKSVGWFSPSEGTPDLFNACADLSTNLSVPMNSFGFQQAHTGNGYAGFVIYGQGTDYREYLATKLTSTLEAGHIYEISFYINLPEQSPIASNNLGFGFLADSAHFNTAGLLQILNADQSATTVMDSINWIKLSFIYKADGFENCLVIGNFKSDSETANIVFENNGSDQYYFIDDISIIEILSEVENIFTPNGDGTNDIAFHYGEVTFLSVEVFNRWGNTVNSIDVSKGWDGNDVEGRPLIDGVYFYQIKLYNKEIIKTGLINLIR